MAQVKLPNSFFLKSRLEYSDWRWALFREFIQNCYDARATRIDFTIYNLEAADGSRVLHIVCQDNGHGMDQDTLKNVLLCLGGSKKESGSVGGFGYAKSLIYFSMDSYSIASRNNLVEGEGGNYTIKQVKSPIIGTRSEIVFTEPNFNVDFESILRKYSTYINVERPLTITLNGRPLDLLFTDFEYKVDTKLGSLMFREEENSSVSQLVVSVRGLPMFVHKINHYGNKSAFTGLLELEGDSFELLTANRDGLHTEPADLLNAIVQNMLNERSKLKCGKVVEIILNATSSGAATTEPQPSSNTISTQAVLEQIQHLTNVDYPNNFRLRLQNVVGKRSKDQNNVVTVSEVLRLLKKENIVKLSYVWSSLVRSVLSCEVPYKYGVRFIPEGSTEVSDVKLWELGFHVPTNGDFYLGGKRITTGFIIDPVTEGQNSLNRDDGGISILANPQFFRKDFKYGDLLDVAVHECSHLLIRGHSEEFTRADIDHRRSLRRFVSEAKLFKEVKLLVENQC